MTFAGTSHLFLAYSALQLIIAQLIAKSLPGGDRKVLWLSTPHPGSSLKQTMQGVLINDLWHEVQWTDINFRYCRARGLDLLNRPFQFLRQVESTRQELHALAETCNADVAYLPHWWDWTCKELADWFKRRSRKTALFEEGLGLYHLSSPQPDMQPLARRAVSFCVDHVLDTMLACRGLSHLASDISKNIDNLYCFFPELPTVVRPRDQVLALAGMRSDDLLEMMRSSPVFAPTREYLRKLRAGGRSALFISSVDVEDLLIPRSVYVRSIRQFLDYLCGRYDRVLFKLHPRNDSELIDDLLKPFDREVARVREPVNVPVELCFGDFGVEAVAGTYSSPLIYLPMFHNVKSISAVPLLIQTARAMGLLSERHSTSAQKFVAGFGHLVEMVDVRAMMDRSR